MNDLILKALPSTEPSKVEMESPSRHILARERPLPNREMRLSERLLPKIVKLPTDKRPPPVAVITNEIELPILKKFRTESALLT
jgi:hypothetical protein